jgi:ATP-dependent helicase/nuclease subunit A
MKQPTDSQWEAVRACDEHVLVEAGAGTGKTATVVWRILYLLGVEVRGARRDTPVALSDIVAITFTRQAASDLKRDLRRALREHGRRADAYAVDQARIGTIHGFCSDLVHEHTLRRGGAPIGGVLEEGEALAWSEECVRDELVSALETGSIAGLDTLLGAWEVGRVEGWALRLMQSPHRLAALRVDDHSANERALIALASRSLRRLEARLGAEGVIDYDRMIGWTRDLLHAEHGVRGALQRRIHTLIVDEFQDTDGLQREIAYLLAEPASGRADTPRLMLVGDPKQSIYRFRGADVTVWSGVRRDFEEHGHGRLLPLQDNFRSVPSVLSFVEATAGTWLDQPVADGGELQDYEVRFRRVAATRQEPADACIEFLLVSAAADGKQRRADERRRLEAHAIAARLRELHASGTPWRDMALLLRTWTSLETYAGALRNAGIPVYALRDDDFLETREVIDLIVALQAIRDPRDDRAVFGFLRSPFVSLRDDTLLAIAVHSRRPYARHIEPAALPESDRVAAGMALLEQLAELRDRIPAAELLDELIQRTGYMAHLALLGDEGAQAALNVRRFLQLLGEMEESSVGMVLRALTERRARKDSVPQARLHGERDDIVLITSVHMAKGLDWPLVVFGDLGNGDHKNGEKLLVGRDLIRLGEPELTAQEQPAPWAELRARLQLEEDAEEKRVTYVALTRPKDRLILAGLPLGTGSARGSLAGELLAAMPLLRSAQSATHISFHGADGIERRALVRVAADDDMVRSDVAREPVADLGAVALPPLPVPAPVGLTRHSATELLAFSRCERRHRFKYVLGIREPSPGGRGGEVMVGAVARGQIVHDVLERYEEDAELAALLEDAIGRWDADAPPPDSTVGRTYRSELSGEIERVLALPEYAALAHAPGARRELKFLYVLGDGAAMQGAIDLAAPAAGGVALVDVKTSRIDAGAARKKAAEYAPQQDVYVSAVAALATAPVHQFGFVFSGPGTSVVTHLDERAADAARSRVEQTVTHMAAAPGRLAADPRECFFCGYRRAQLCPGVQPVQLALALDAGAGG